MGALNSVFKALSVDLESLGVYGGRVTADADLTRLMGVVEAKTQKVMGSYAKVLAKEGSSEAASRVTAGASQPASPVSVKSQSDRPGTPGERPGSGGGLSLPHIPGRAFGRGNSAEPGFGVVASDVEDDDSEDEDDFVKPMSSVDLKRSMRTTLSIGSMTSPKGGGGFV